MTAFEKCSILIGTYSQITLQSTADAEGRNAAARPVRLDAAFLENGSSSIPARHGLPVRQLTCSDIRALVRNTGPIQVCVTVSLEHSVVPRFGGKVLENCHQHSGRSW